MKITITSIQPPHTDHIFKGNKIIEWRKRPLPLGIHDVYETRKKNGAGLVIGRMEIIRHYFFNCVEEIPDYLIEEGCVSRAFLKAYAGQGPIYANVIFDPKRFEIPRILPYYKKPSDNSKIYLPPQSFMYAVDEEI